MDESAVDHWIGESAEEVLAELDHEIRGPIYNAVGFLNVLNSADGLSLSPEQVQQYMDLALNNALHAQAVVDSVFQYMNKQRRDR